MAHSDVGQLHATVTTWPSATPRSASDHGSEGALEEEFVPLPDFSRVGLLLCFASAVLTLIGIGSALERIFT